MVLESLVSLSTLTKPTNEEILEVITKYHPDEKVKEEAGRKLLEYYEKEGTLLPLIYLIKDKTVPEKIREMGKEMVESAVEKTGDVFLLLRLQERGLPEGIKYIITKKIKELLPKTVEECKRRRLYGDLMILEESNIPSEIKRDIEGFLREQAINLYSKGI